MSLLGLGCIAFTRRAALDTESRLNIAAASVAVTLTCHFFSPHVDGYYQPVIARIGAVVAIGVLATAVIAFHHTRHGRSPRSALLAGLCSRCPRPGSGRSTPSSGSSRWTASPRPFRSARPRHRCHLRRDSACSR